ncbi:RDD family protein [Streptomyces litmocidini]|uniref:RDD family protein n=1 Tax=Streptomyces litmocidini TaxID=67318 RepID=UPI00167E31BA|nr:RDD family protein [Streptomyces litmocidini]
MSTDQPPPGQPPEDDPFSKRPPEPPPGGPPPSGPPPGGPPPGGPPPGSPYDSPYGGGSPYDNMPPPPPPYGSPHGGGYGGNDPLSGMPPLAETGRRVLARLIDWVIIAVPLAIIGIPFDIYQRATRDGNDFGDTVNSFNGGSQLVFQLITIVAYVAYDTVLTAKNGRTVGKRLMKLRVAMLNDGTTPPMSQSLLRAVVLWLPALICCACLWPLLILILIVVDKPYKQGLHDKAAKTVVVSAPQ